MTTLSDVKVQTQIVLAFFTVLLAPPGENDFQCLFPNKEL